MNMEVDSSERRLSFPPALAEHSPSSNLDVKSPASIVSRKSTHSARVSKTFDPDSDDEYDGEYNIPVPPPTEVDIDDLVIVDMNDERAVAAYKAASPATASSAPLITPPVVPVEDSAPKEHPFSLRMNVVDETPNATDENVADSETNVAEAIAAEGAAEQGTAEQGEGPIEGEDEDDSEYDSEDDYDSEEEEDDDFDSEEEDDSEDEDEKDPNCTPFGPRGKIIVPERVEKPVKPMTEERRASLDAVKNMAKITSSKLKKGRINTVMTEEDEKRATAEAIQKRIKKASANPKKVEKFDRSQLRKAKDGVDIYASTEQEAPRRHAKKHIGEDEDEYANDPRAGQGPVIKASLDDPRVPYEELVRVNTIKVYGELSWKELEVYLTEEEFLAVMKVDRENFYTLPKWKRMRKKKEAKLF